MPLPQQLQEEAKYLNMLQTCPITTTTAKYLTWNLETQHVFSLPALASLEEMESNGTTMPMQHGEVQVKYLKQSMPKPWDHREETLKYPPPPKMASYESNPQNKNKEKTYINEYKQVATDIQQCEDISLIPS